MAEETPKMTPTPGQPLRAEDVGLLVKGDVLMHREGVYSFTRPRDKHQVQAERPGGKLFDRTEAFTFIGRPDPEGWMPWSGGENPVPGQMVEWNERDEGPQGPANADLLRWSSLGAGCDIIAFRLVSAEPDRAESGEGASRTAKLEVALTLALDILGAQEPGDSRAVSNEYVAMSAVLCDVEPNHPGEDVAIILDCLRSRSNPNVSDLLAALSSQEQAGAVAWRFRWKGETHDRAWRWAFSEHEATTARLRGYEVRAVFDHLQQQGAVEVARKALEPFSHIVSHVGLPKEDTVHLTSLDGRWIATIAREAFQKAREALAALSSANETGQ